MTSQAVIERTCGGDPTRLKRLAVRFAANVFPGNDVEVQLYDAGTVDGGRHGLRLRGHLEGRRRGQERLGRGRG